MGTFINKRDYIKVQINRRNLLIGFRKKKKGKKKGMKEGRKEKREGEREEGRKEGRREGGKKEGKKVYFHHLVDMLTYMSVI